MTAEPYTDAELDELRNSPRTSLLSYKKTLRLFATMDVLKAERDTLDLFGEEWRKDAIKLRTERDRMRQYLRYLAYGLECCEDGTVRMLVFPRAITAAGLRDARAALEGKDG